MSTVVLNHIEKQGMLSMAYILLCIDPTTGDREELFHLCVTYDHVISAAVEMRDTIERAAADRTAATTIDRAFRRPHYEEEDATAAMKNALQVARGFEHPSTP